MGNKIILIIPWYGNIPPYFNYWLKSLEGRPFDVLWISDVQIEERLPDNLHFLQLTFKELCTLASKKMGVQVSIKYPKKLCDFKPMYGHIFEDHIGTYEYWAFGDCDLVYGQAFDDVLNKILYSGCDVASMRKFWMSGPFCIVRNTEQTRRLYQDAINWRTAIAEDELCNFDELGGSGKWFNEVASGTRSIEDCAKVHDSFTAVVSRWEKKGLKVWRDDVLCEVALHHGQKVIMNSNRLFFIDKDKKGIPVFHYICSKHRNYFCFVSRRLEKISDFVIDETGFYSNTIQKMFRPIINPWRKFVAGCVSVRKYGVRHLFWWLNRLMH